MDFFEEIAKQKEDFPKLHSVTNEVKNQKLNFYQRFAIGIFILFFFLGIVFGNLFSTCATTSYFSSDTCLVTQFNFSLMIVIWFASLLLSIGIYAIGHIIALLSEINQKLTKFR